MSKAYLIDINWFGQPSPHSPPPPPFIPLPLPSHLCVRTREKPKARWTNLIGVLLIIGGRDGWAGIFCTVMKALKSMPYSMDRQELFICKLPSTPFCGDETFTQPHQPSQVGNLVNIGGLSSGDTCWLLDSSRYHTDLQYRSAFEQQFDVVSDIYI